MRNILHVARREYIETIRTKAFLLSIFVAPLVMAVVLLVVARTHVRPVSAVADRRIALCDLTGQLGDELRTRFDAYTQAHPDQRIVLTDVQSGAQPPEDFAERMKERVRRGDLYAYIQIDADAVDGQGLARLYLRSVNLSTIDTAQTVEGIVSRAAFNIRCAEHNLSPELVSSINRRIPAEQITLGAAGQESPADTGRQITSMLVPFFFMFLIFMGITGMAQFMLSSVMEEKASRIIEVLLSAMSPMELLVGKIIGTAAVGFTAIAVWSALAYFAGQRADIDVSVPLGLLPLFLLYYILGFLLITSLLAGVGSVCNSHKEAQSMMMPLMLLLTLPMILWFMVAREPDSTISRILSFVPPMTPMIMVLRLSSSTAISPWETAATVLVLAGAVPLAMYVGGRVFRTGILMYGKRQSFREIARWLWQK